MLRGGQGLTDKTDIEGLMEFDSKDPHSEWQDSLT